MTVLSSALSANLDVGRSVILETALQIAQDWGWPVFPCAANKKPCIAKEEGGQGFLDASTDPEVIRRLFRHRGAKLIGVPTGEASGVDALDLDYRHGADVFEAANAHRLPETRAHRTQNGGRHLLFRHTPGVVNSESRIASGVDVRGAGGYIITPPSPGYSVDSDAEIADWPEWLLPDALPKPFEPRPARGDSASGSAVSDKRLSALIAAIIERVRQAPEGQKHSILRCIS